MSSKQSEPAEKTLQHATSELANPLRVSGVDEYRTYPPGSMHFSQFAILQKGLAEKCGSFYEEFPFAAMVLDKAIRNLAFGHVEFQLQKSEREKRGVAKQLLFGLARRAGGQARCGEHGTYYSSLNGFEWFSDELDKRLSLIGLKPIGAQKRFGLRRKKLLQSLAVKGQIFRETHNAAASRGLAEVIKDRAMMARLDDQVQRNIEAIKSEITKQRIRLFLTTGDASDHARVFCYAAQALGVPYVVLAHGYVQHYALLTIAPIKADALVVWTAEQARAIASAVDAHDAVKIHHFCYPKPLWPKSDKARRLAGIIWHPIFHMPNRDYEIEQLIRLVQKVAAQGYEIIVRLHPKDRLDKDLNSRLQNNELTLSKGHIEDDLGPASLIIGSRSSVLVEAALSGKTVIQIDEYRLNHLESVQQISIESPKFNEVVRKADKTVAPPVSPFDFDRFIDFLSDAMQPKARSRH